MEAMRQLLNLLPDNEFGYIYADGSYSDQREPRACTVVPRRPRADAEWDMHQRAWLVNGQPVTRPNPSDVVETPTAPVAPPPPPGKMSVDDILNTLSQEERLELLAKMATAEGGKAESKPAEVKPAITL